MSAVLNVIQTMTVHAQQTVVLAMIIMIIRVTAIVWVAVVAISGQMTVIRASQQ